ncbi:MAG: hypothetical protein AAF564_14655 [Bacteroidota bacterium]
MKTGYPNSAKGAGILDLNPHQNRQACHDDHELAYTLQGAMTTNTCSTSTKNMTMPPNARLLSSLVGLMSIVCIAMTSLPRATFAQTDSTLIRVHALELEATTGALPVHYSSGKKIQATELSALLAKAAAYLATSLRVSTEINVALLSRDDWPAVWPFPYGLPYASLNAPWVVVMPATPEESVLYPGFVGLLNEIDARTMISNIGFHEIGHVYTSEYLYPPDIDGPPLRWLDELLAQYLAYAVMQALDTQRAAIWDTFTTAMLNLPSPKYTTLEAFEAEYNGFLATPEGAQNYGWYQSLFAAKAGELFKTHGIALFSDLKTKLDWSNVSNWSTATAITNLESVAPGFQAWHDAMN